MRAFSRQVCLDSWSRREMWCASARSLVWTFVETGLWGMLCEALPSQQVQSLNVSAFTRAAGAYKGCQAVWVRALYPSELIFKIINIHMKISPNFDFCQQRKLSRWGITASDSKLIPIGNEIIIVSHLYAPGAVIVSSSLDPFQLPSFISCWKRLKSTGKPRTVISIRWELVFSVCNATVCLQQRIPNLHLLW